MLALPACTLAAEALGACLCGDRTLIVFIVADIALGSCLSLSLSLSLSCREALSRFSICCEALRTSGSGSQDLEVPTFFGREKGGVSSVYIGQIFLRNMRFLRTRRFDGLVGCKLKTPC